MWVPVAIAAYLLAVHASVLGGEPWPALIILSAFLAWTAVRGLRTRAVPQVLVASLLLAAVVAAWGSGWGIAVLHLPPLIIPGYLLFLFARSLRPGATPLVTRFARLLDGELDAATARYTRRVTQAWVVFFALLTLHTGLLPLWATPEVWSLFANFLNYLFIPAFFVIEYAVRHHFLPHRTQAGFVSFMRRLAALDVRRVMREL